MSNCDETRWNQRRRHSSSYTARHKKAGQWINSQSFQDPPADHQPKRYEKRGLGRRTSLPAGASGYQNDRFQRSCSESPTDYNTSREIRGSHRTNWRNDNMAVREEGDEVQRLLQVSCQYEVRKKRTTRSCSVDIASLGRNINSRLLSRSSEDDESLENKEDERFCQTNQIVSVEKKGKSRLTQRIPTSASENKEEVQRLLKSFFAYQMTRERTDNPYSSGVTASPMEDKEEYMDRSRTNLTNEMTTQGNLSHISCEDTPAVQSENCNDVDMKKELTKDCMEVSNETQKLPLTHPSDDTSASSLLEDEITRDPMPNDSDDSYEPLAELNNQDTSDDDDGYKSVPEEPKSYTESTDDEEFKSIPEVRSNTQEENSVEHNDFNNSSIIESDTNPSFDIEKNTEYDVPSPGVNPVDHTGYSVKSVVKVNSVNPEASGVEVYGETGKNNTNENISFDVETWAEISETNESLNESGDPNYNFVLQNLTQMSLTDDGHQLKSISNKVSSVFTQEGKYTVDSPERNSLIILNAVNDEEPALFENEIAYNEKHDIFGNENNDIFDNENNDIFDNENNDIFDNV